LSSLHLLKSWSLRQTRGGSVPLAVQIIPTDAQEKKAQQETEREEEHAAIERQTLEQTVAEYWTGSDVALQLW